MRNDLTQTDVERCTIADIGISLTGDDAQPLVDAINEYLQDFAKPVKRDGGGSFAMGRYVCLKCGESLDGMLGRFRWGIAWGEGHCTGCGWPGRAYHIIKDKDGDIFERPLELILQYHPSVVEKTAVDTEVADG